MITGASERRRRRPVSYVVGLLAAMLLLSGCDFSVQDAPLPGGTDTGERPIEVEVEFADVLDLVPQSRVKVDDVDVGTVTGIELEHGVAVVSIELRRDVELPADAVASIGQTSLLGEKYVELAAPAQGPSRVALADGDRIPLSRSGRNPEVEEVLGALSLILNGGGVAQLRTISRELDDALAGREDSARSVLHEVQKLMRNLDRHKGDITTALRKVTRLSKQVHRHQGAIDSALDELPAALNSIDSQRRDLVRMLRALNRLGETGVRVIRASKKNTVAVVRDLEPVLRQLGLAGDDLVDSFNLLLTYPFVDESVGTTAQQARSLHMGDYVNLDITLNLDLRSLSSTPAIPGLPNVCQTLGDLGAEKLDLEELSDLLNGQNSLCPQAIERLNDCIFAVNQAKSDNKLALPEECLRLPQGLLDDITGGLLRELRSTGEGLLDGLTGGLRDGLRDGLTGGLSGGLSPGGEQPRAAVNGATPHTPVRLHQLAAAYDPGLVSLLAPPLDLPAGGTP